MAPLQKLQSRCFGGQSPEATDVSTCESSFSLCSTHLHAFEQLLLLLPLPSFAPLPPLTCPPSHSPLSPSSPPPRLTGGQALPKSRECCPRLGLGFGLLLPHPPLFKHLPASENIPHCLSLRGGAGYFSKCINSKRATKGQNINIGKIPNGLQILYSCVSSFKVQNCLHVSLLAKITKSKCRHLPTKSTSSCVFCCFKQFLYRFLKQILDRLLVGFHERCYKDGIFLGTFSIRSIP